MRLLNGKIKKFAINFNIKNKTLKNRLWVFQALLVSMIIIGILAVLFFTDTFHVLSSQLYTALNLELERTNSDVSKRFFVITQTCYNLADEINKSICKSLDEYDLTAADIKNNPDLLETILNKEVEKANFAVQRANCSGVFIILDATINPTLSDAKYSKAGFYIKNIEPNPVMYSTNVPILLRGFPQIARDYDMYLDTEWQLEFDINHPQKNIKTDYYSKPFNAALRYCNKDIKVLGYWAKPFKLDKNNKKVLTFSVPLIDKNDFVYGVCGLELSEHFLNEYLNMPLEYYDKIFYLLGIKNTEKKQMSVSNSIHLGNYSKSFTSLNPEYLSLNHVDSNNDKISKYAFDNNQKNSLLGLETVLNIYNSKSVYKQENWTLIVLTPSNDIIKTKSTLLIIAIVILFILGILLAYTFSKIYTRPISLAFDNIIEKSEKIDKTDIIEIDNLIAFIEKHQLNLSNHNDVSCISEADNILPQNNNAMRELIQEQYLEFKKQLESLTKTEREIFNMLLQGYATKQICDERCISINTLKTHNSRIYSKLNVKSRSQLLSYCYKIMNEFSETSLNK